MHANLGSYALAGAIIFGLNLLPAFSPPTWAVVVFLTLTFDLHPVPMVPLAAIAATGGRIVLALGSRRARGWFSKRRIASLKAASDALAKSRKTLWGVVAFFFISPLPSSQLFVAVGILDLKIRPIAIAFFCGRLVTYGIYLGGAHAIKKSSSEVFLNALKSPLGIGLQVLMVLVLGIVFAIDWSKVLGKKHRRSGH